MDAVQEGRLCSGVLVLPYTLMGSHPLPSWAYWSPGGHPAVSDGPLGSGGVLDHGFPLCAAAGGCSQCTSTY